jgi:type IV pilus assembly protein PilM
MGLFSHKESYLGVDIGADGIKVVELRKTKGRPQLWTYGIAEQAMDIHIPVKRDKNVTELIHEDIRGYESKDAPDEPTTLQELIMQDARVDEYSKLLKLLLKEAKVETRRATSSLPVSHVFHTIINLPTVDPKELNDIVRAEVAKMLPRPIDEMQIVFQLIPQDAEKKQKFVQVLVTAAPKALVAFYTAIFQKAGIELVQLETEAFALSRSLVGLDPTVSMVVDMGAERSNFFIVDRGLPMTHRSLHLGGDTIDQVFSKTLDLPIGDVAEIKKDISRIQNMSLPSDLFLHTLDPLVKEIQYSFDIYFKQTGNEQKRPEKIILTGGASLFTPVRDYIASKFDLKVFIGDPWARVIYQDGLKIILDGLGPRMAVSIGLALRNF